MNPNEKEKARLDKALDEFTEAMRKRLHAFAMMIWRREGKKEK